MDADNKKLLTPSRMAALLWLVLLALFYGQGLGAVMRESDQASLLEGALCLAREWQVRETGFYNYDNQWLSYWLLSLPVKWALHYDPHFDLGRLVHLGNLVAFGVGFAGLAAAYLYGAGKSWSVTLAGGVLFLVPTWMFSAPLLSSNVFSLGFLGFWVLAVETLRGRWRLVFSGVLAFLAVGCRADAVLVFPALALAWWGVGRSWKDLWRAGTLWAAGLAAFAALGVGIFLKGGASGSYATFFQTKTFFAYLFFGLGGAVFFYLGLLWVVATGFWKSADKWESARALVWAGLLFLPLLFYGRLLFTPRHLLTAFLVLLLSACLSGAQTWWCELVRGRGRWMFALGCVTLVLPMFLGLRLDSLRSGKWVVASETTLFPTADGLWSMGRYVDYMGDLGNSAVEAIDHNQRVWGAWQRLTPEAEWRGQEVAFRSAGLLSYGMLWATWHDLSYVLEEKKAKKTAVVLGDDRSLMKQKISVSGALGAEVAGDQKREKIRVRSEYQLGRVLEFVADSDSEGSYDAEGAQDFLATCDFLREKYGGDAFLLARPGMQENMQATGNYRWGIVRKGTPPDSANSMMISDKLWYEELSKERVEKERGDFLFLIRSELPRFFSVSTYGNR